MRGFKQDFPHWQDYIELSYDLNRELIKNSSSSFIGRVKGFSMSDEGIEPGDLLTIDKSLNLEDGDMCVCFLEGEFALKCVKVD